MAWKNGFYYRNKRVGGRVVSKYIGPGILGEYAAQLDAHERAQADGKRQSWQVIIDAEDAIDDQIDAVGAQLGQLVEATYLIAGYHQHKRQWRKKR